MAAKKKRMTQKEKDLNRAWKKEMQEKGRSTDVRI